MPKVRTAARVFPLGSVFPVSYGARLEPRLRVAGWVSGAAGRLGIRRAAQGPEEAGVAQSI